MKREIKFRAWDTVDKWMDNHFWVYSEGSAYDIPDKTHNTPHTEVEQKPNLIIMQYTGLKDCNGVEIYEGDILRDDGNECLWLVGFSERGCFIAHDPDDRRDFVLLDDYEFKVLGNIYENPELLGMDDANK